MSDALWMTDNNFPTYNTHKVTIVDIRGLNRSIKPDTPVFNAHFYYSWTFDNGNKGFIFRVCMCIKMNSVRAPDKRKNIIEKVNLRQQSVCPDHSTMPMKSKSNQMEGTQHSAPKHIQYIHTDMIIIEYHCSTIQCSYKANAHKTIHWIASADDFYDLRLIITIFRIAFHIKKQMVYGDFNRSWISMQYKNVIENTFHYYLTQTLHTICDIRYTICESPI